MKRLLVLFVAAAMLFLFAACDSLPDKEIYEPEDIPNVPLIQKTTFGINETAVFDDLKFTATEVKMSSGQDFYTPEAGNVFVGIKFIIENISQEEQAVSSLLLFDGYADDIKCAYSFSATCAFAEGTIDGNIAPGKKMVGWYALEVPAEWSNIDLVGKANLWAASSATFAFENEQ